MAVYYKFKSAKDFDLIPIDGHYISVINLKQKIFESKHLGRGKDFDLVVTNAQTNQGYLDEDMLIPKNTSVLICRVPGLPRKPIVTQPDMPKVEDEPSDPQPAKSSFFGADSSALKYLDDSEWDDFGNDLYAIPEAPPVQRIDPIMDAPPPSKADEDSKIQALIETPALDWQHQASNGSGGGRGFGRGIGGKMMGGRGFGRQDCFERKTPPEHYVCHRCKVPGHFIQHCPTNGDPNYDVKRVRPPTGIPKSMLMATPDGSYALPSGVVAVLKPNEAAFEKEIEGLPSTLSVGDLPPELNCPLCKEVMKDAALTSRCCFKSFCDKCIRDHIISRSMCACGATNVLADDLLPNKTLRDTIDRILESNSSSAEKAGSAFNVRDMESARCPQPRVSSPNLAVTSMQDKLPQTCNEETSSIKVTIDEEKSADASQLTPEKEKMAKTVDMSEAAPAAISVKEATLRQASAPLAEGLLPNSFGEAGKKKRQKTCPPMNAGDLHWNNSQDLATENYTMPFGASPYNPYWTGVQIGMDGYMASYPGPMNYMNYGFGPMDMPFLGVVPPDPFVAQHYILPGILPQRDLAEFGMGFNATPPIMSREEFEAPKADLKRKREKECQKIKRRAEMRDQNISRGVGSNGDISSMKSKSGSIPPMSIPESHRPRRSEKLSPEHSNHEAKSPRPQKRKADHHHNHRDHPNSHRDRHNSYTHHGKPHRHDRPEPLARLSSTGTATEPPTAESKSADGKQKRSIFSRIGFPDEEAPKKRKYSSTVAAAGGASSFTSVHHRGSPKGYYEDRKSSSTPTSSDVVGIRGSAMEYDESSDDDRHFKRKSSRYEPSPPPPERER